MISLSIPGINSKTITSAEQRFASANFSINGQRFRKGEEGAEPPAGSIIYRIEWKGEGAKMPPVSHKKFEEETAADTLETEE